MGAAANPARYNAEIPTRNVMVGQTGRALQMWGNLELGRGGGGGYDALRKGRGRPITFGVALFCLGRTRQSPPDKQSKEEQSTPPQPWGKEELQRGRDFDM